MPSKYRRPVDQRNTPSFDQESGHNKPGPKARKAYGRGIAAKGGSGRRQVTVTLADKSMSIVNRAAEYSGMPRATIIEQGTLDFIRRNPGMFGPSD